MKKVFGLSIMFGLLLWVVVPYVYGEGGDRKSTGGENVTTQVHEELSGEIINGVREIRIEAFQFGFKPDTIVVKKGEKVRFIVKSTDVLHGIGIKEFDINEPLPPGEEKKLEFTPDKVGKFPFHCSVYCGIGHGKMHGKLIVIDNEGEK